jgi:hypothetical protein
MSDNSVQQIMIVTTIWWWQIRLAVSKQTTHRFHMEKINLKKLNKVEGKEQYHVEKTNSFAALENYGC